LLADGAMSRGRVSRRGRVLAGAGIGVLAWVVPPGLVDEVVAGCRERRLRSLPSRFGVYFVLGLCLFSYLPYGQVVRELTAGLEAGLAAAGWQVPASTALTGVRRRVGEGPLESLFGRVCPAVPPGREEWSHLCGLLAVAWDGTTVDVQDTAANAAAFGRPGTRRKPAGGGPGGAAFPQLRMVALVACGTRALLGAAFGPARGKDTGERHLAGSLLGRLGPGMLVLADRNFYGYPLWNAAAGTGADLLWRVKSSMRLPVIRELPDGSWLARVSDPRAVRARTVRNGTRRRRGSRLPPDTGAVPGITVRVIEFTLTVTTAAGARTERYRLITTLADWRACPAADLAAGYAWRWAIETGFAEFKTWLRGPGRRLRGKTPDLARQELWAYLIIYQAIRALIARAAAGPGLDPDRISFTAALRAARRTITTARTSMTAALAQAEAEITATLNPLRQARTCVRAVKKTRSPYPSRNTRPAPIAHHAAYTLTITPPPATTQTPAHQPKQPPRQPRNPP